MASEALEDLKETTWMESQILAKIRFAWEAKRINIMVGPGQKPKVFSFTMITSPGINGISGTLPR